MARERPLVVQPDADGRLSAQLRQSRKWAGFGLRAAAAAAGCDPGHLSHVEHADTLPSEALVVDLDVLYETNGLLLSLYEEVLAERRRRAYSDALQRRAKSPPLLEEAQADQDRWLPDPDAVLPIAGDLSIYIGEGETPIGVLLQQGTWFTKSWQIQNCGTVVWRDRFLKRVGPNAAATLVNTQRAVPVPDARPGDIVTVEVRCRAQWIESTSVAHFKMVFADGRLCWPDQYSHGVDLLVTATNAPSCGCASCRAVGPLEPIHRRLS